MKDGLAREGAAIDHQPVALGDLQVFRQLPGHQHHFAQQQGVPGLRLRDADNVPVGDDEDVDRRLRARVVEGGHFVVLIDDARRGLPADDTAKDTVRHKGHSSAVSFPRLRSNRVSNVSAMRMTSPASSSVR